MTMKNQTLTLATALTFLLGAVVVFTSIAPTSQAAPPAAPTPIANMNSSGGMANAQLLFNSTVITQDTIACTNMANYRTVSVQYAIVTNTNVNTLTLTDYFSNVPGFYSPGGAVASNVTVKTETYSDTMVARANFGQRYCIFADVVTNTNLTITVGVLGQ
jgi:hypothetical protein